MDFSNGLFQQFLEGFLSPYMVSQTIALVQVILIDLVMSADNGLIVGLAAAGLAPELRKKAIILGITLAVVFRVAFASVTIYLLTIPGLLLIGGLLLLWVCYKMWLDLRRTDKETAALTKKMKEAQKGKKKTFFNAMTQITIADISMSLDNVLAVAAASREHPYIMIFGLALSIVMMATVANYVAVLLKKYPIIGYIGLAVLVYVTGKLLYQGTLQLLEYSF